MDANTEKAEIAQQLQEARKKAGLTQKAMSEQLSIPLRTIEDWEHGRRTPPIWTVKLIVEKLNNL